MSQYLQKKLRETLENASADAATLAEIIAGSPLEEWFCALSGIESERIRALADGAPFKASELLCLYAATESIVQNQENQDYGWKDRPSQSLLSCAAMNELLSSPQAAQGRNEWLDRVSECVLRERDFCADLAEASAAKSVDEFFSSYYFFVDALVLCSNAMQDFLEQFIPIMERLGRKEPVVAPSAVVACLQKEMREPSVISNAAEGMVRLKKFHEAGLLTERGEGGDTTLTSVFLSAFSRYKPSSRLVFLTQDEKLAGKVQQLNEILDEGEDILIAYLEEDGVARLWFAPETESAPDDEEDTDGTPSLVDFSVRSWTDEAETRTSEEEEAPSAQEDETEASQEPDSFPEFPQDEEISAQANADADGGEDDSGESEPAREEIPEAGESVSVADLSRLLLHGGEAPFFEQSGEDSAGEGADAEISGTFKDDDSDAPSAEVKVTSESVWKLFD